MARRLTAVRDIHIAPSDSSAGSIMHATGLMRNVLLTHQDDLSTGPLPRVLALNDWLRTRDAYWLTLVPEFEEDQNYVSESHLVEGIDRLQGAERINLWVGTSLREQLFLAWMVSFLDSVNIDPARLHVIQFQEKAASKFPFVEVGFLNEQDLQAHPAPAALSPDQIDEADAMWNAVTSPDPDALLEILAEPSGPLPYLRRAVRSLLFYYPEAQSGLNLWEQVLTKNVRDKGPSAAHAIAYTMSHDVDFPDFPGGFYLFSRLRRLSDQALNRPLLRMGGGGRHMGDTTVKVTNDGLAAIEGKLNFVETNGIDDWVGGVHLDSTTGNVWFRGGETLLRG